MALEEVKRIRLAEDEAAKKLADARVRAKAVTDSAAANAEKAYNSALEDAVLRGKKRVEDESRRAEEEAKGLFEQNALACREIENGSAGKLPQAVEFIISETLK